MKVFYAGIWLFLLTLFLGHFALTGQAVYGDGIGYYAHLHSWYIDHDWDSTNEYKHIYSPENNARLQPLSAAQVQIVGTSQSGRALNHYSTGMAVLLLPWYVAADLFTRFYNMLGFSELSTTGFSAQYQLFCGIGAVSFVVLGLYFLEKTLEHLQYSVFVSRLTVVCVVGGTSLLYYGGFDVINSHFGSFFAASAFFFVCITWPESLKKYALLGALAGLALTIRIQDSLLLLLPLVHLTRTHSRHKAAAVTALSAAFILGSLPTLYQVLMVLPLSEHTYLREVQNIWTHQSPFGFWGSLFHPVTGLFTRTPLVGGAFAYILWLLWHKKLPHFFILPLCFFVLQYVIISLQGGWHAAAFGGRMYISSLFVFALAGAEGCTQLEKKYSQKFLLGVVAFGVALTCILFVQFVLFAKHTENDTLGTEQRTLLRITRVFSQF